MPRYDAGSLADLEARLERDDPRFARSLATGRPIRPREYRRAGTWAALAVSTVVLLVGVVVAHGLLIAAGLVFMGVAAQLLDPTRSRTGR
ncbi:DUF3040 domain-containing protein [Streptomyces griseoviridis]|uniref:DUF3040 domain-containing protein n=1 Tax=Streptomyces hintoniae TaxID=3075521 RepID=A0ABU2UTH6_9ACTN|nr:MULTISPECIES: DUF3040 domain-containing protein [Streptomyces]MDT0476573.1 DUF3040 domain-containing protein [Streptomyces sp. DSM 41014]